jgi:hypothetical protein
VCEKDGVEVADMLYARMLSGLEIGLSQGAAQQSLNVWRGYCRLDFRQCTELQSRSYLLFDIPLVCCMRQPNDSGKVFMYMKAERTFSHLRMMLSRLDLLLADQF